MAMMLVAVMALAMFAGCGSSSGASEEDKAAAQAALDALGLTGDFEPNTEYDYYTLVDYTIESANAQFVATVCKTSDNKKYEVHCLFYGDEQLVVIENGEITMDKTGFMETDSPLIVEKAEKQAVWVPIK